MPIKVVAVESRLAFELCACHDARASKLCQPTHLADRHQRSNERPDPTFELGLVSFFRVNEGTQDSEQGG